MSQKPYAERVLYFQQWHQKHKARRLLALRARKRKNRKEVRAYLEALKSSPCTDCRRRFPTCVMQFDHLRDKKHEIAVMLNGGMPLETVKRELEKCELVCANCHCIRTHRRRQARLAGFEPAA